MADDLLLSPEEQDERVKQWLKDNGLALVVGVVLGLGAVYGYNSYKDLQKSKAEQASALYDSVLSAVNQSDIADIEDRVKTLKDNYAGSSYAAKAVLMRARQLSVSDIPAALAELQWVAENTSEIGIKHAARIRQAKLLVTQGDLAAAKSAATADDYDGFDSYYQEILGDIAAQEQAYDKARGHYQDAINTLGSADIGYRSILTLKLNRLPASSSPEGSGEVARPEGDSVVREDEPIETQ
ncbi:MAG: tetratricopeptide repeat protein [Gammaproteobacteria bacterium]|nr:tetratricopeptide repeat protein [Gammaproteobacteria bacterium]